MCVLCPSSYPMPTYVPLGATYVPPEDNRKPSVCPLCGGDGEVPDRSFDGTAAVGVKKKCPAWDCRGGIVWPP